MNGTNALNVKDELMLLQFTFFYSTGFHKISLQPAFKCFITVDRHDYSLRNTIFGINVMAAFDSL